MRIAFQIFFPVFGSAFKFIHHGKGCSHLFQAFRRSIRYFDRIDFLRWKKLSRRVAPDNIIDPIDNIIRRNTTTQLFPTQEVDTIKVPDAPPERLEQMAAALAMMDEFKSAAKYWEKYLESDPHNMAVTTSLMLAYL